MAFIRDDPGLGVVRVVSCDSTVTWLDAPEERLRDRDVYDVDVAGQYVDVLVRDKSTGAPAAGAKIHYASLVDLNRDQARFATHVIAGKDGRARLGPLRPGILLSVCASTPTWQLTCAPRAKLVRDTSPQQVTIELADGPRRGRIEIPTAIANGTLYWLSPFGAITETITIAPDRSFEQTQVHAAGERAVLVASNLPLDVLFAKGGDDSDVLVLRPGSSAVQNLIIDAAQQFPGRGAVALAINGVRIPEVVVACHQTLRGLSSTITPGETLTIPQVSAQKPSTRSSLPPLPVRSSESAHQNQPFHDLRG